MRRCSCNLAQSPNGRQLKMLPSGFAWGWPIKLQPFHVSTRIEALVGHVQVVICLGTFAPPGNVRGVPTSLSVSLPTRQLTLGGVISAVAHMDFCFERCSISFRPASPLWCSTGTALSRSPHWTGLTLRRVQNEKPHRVHQLQRWSHPGPAHATSSIDHQVLPFPIPQIRLPTTFAPQLCLVSCCPLHYGKRHHVRTTIRKVSKPRRKTHHRSLGGSGP